MAKTTQTPLCDFLVKLADSAYLDSFRKNPEAILDSSALSADLRNLILSQNRGLIRIRAVQELEKAGFSPVYTNKIDSDGTVLQPINTNNFNNTTITTTTFTSNTSTSTNYTTTTVTSNNDNTTTTTTNSGDIGWLDPVSIIDNTIDYFSKKEFSRNGSLFIIGTGIKPIVDLSLGSEAHIKSADIVLYCVADPATEKRIHELNRNSISLYGLYDNGKPRDITYRQMRDQILNEVRADRRVCVAFYGHPGIFARAPHEAIRIARAEGFRAEMTPAVSAEDTLFADLGLDPSSHGVQSLDATDFLVHNRHLDTSFHVILWQPECVGDSGFNFGGYKRHNFPILINSLFRYYAPDHPIVIYDASTFHHLPPQIRKKTISTISVGDLSGISTLYIPPTRAPSVDWDMARHLGLAGAESGDQTELSV